MWQLPNLLALEAPLIALVWQAFAGQCWGTPASAAARVVLGLTVWAIYVGDRLLDIRVEPPATDRHAFCLRYKTWFIAGLLVAVCTVALISLFFLDRVMFRGGIALATATVIYLGVFPVLGNSSVSGKKALAALLFTSGIFLSPAMSTANTVPAAALFLLLLGNLVLVESWDTASRSRVLWPWLFALALGALFGHGAWFVIVAACATALAVVDAFGGRLPVPARCALADAILLLPLVTLAVQQP